MQARGAFAPLSAGTCLAQHGIVQSGFPHVVPRCLPSDGARRMLALKGADQVGF